MARKLTPRPILEDWEWRARACARGRQRLGRKPLGGIVDMGRGKGTCRAEAVTSSHQEGTSR